MRIPAAVILCACLLPLTADTRAGAILEPAGDKYMYPFIDDSAVGGKRGYAGLFGAYGAADDPAFDFDDRDAQFFLDFITTPLAPAGHGASNYRVLSFTVTIVVENDLGFSYDPTFDPLASYVNPSSDADPGRPIELYGVGYRSGWTRSTFNEESPFQTEPSTLGMPNWNRKRNAFAMDFDAQGLARDVSNNVDEQFEVNPWAVADSPGEIDLDGNYIESSLAPGALVPEGRVFRFQVDAANPHINAYLRDGLDAGRLHLMVSSLYDTVERGTSFPRFYTKDNAEHLPASGIYLAPQVVADVLVMPAPAITRIGSGFRVSFDTIAGQNYQLEYRDNLGPGDWLPLGDPLAGDGHSRSVEDTTAQGKPARFYRVAISKNLQP
jgi:hypothetical protein